MTCQFAGLLTNEQASHIVTTTSVPAQQMVLFVGRHVKHKGVRQLPEIFAAARVLMPALQMVVASDGPERASLEGDVARMGLGESIQLTGPISDEELRGLYARASCTVVPSLREGYGIVVAESVAAGTPVVVANNPENLATTLVESGVNGYVVSPSVGAMAQGIVDAIEAGEPLRQSTAEWSARHAVMKSMDRSADEMVERVSRYSRRSPSKD